MRSIFGNNLVSWLLYTTYKTKHNVLASLHKYYKTKHNTDKDLPFARSQKCQHQYITSKGFSALENFSNN